MSKLLSRMRKSVWRHRLDAASVVLTVYSLVCLLLELELEGDTIRESSWWNINEFVIAVMFVADYLVRWYLAEDRLKYPFTFYAIIDLLAVLPFILAIFADPGDLAGLRVLRLVRVLRLYRHTDSLDLFLLAFYRCRSELATVVTIVLLVILVSSLAVYYFEHPVQPDKIARPSDGMWWCVVTMSTVGYGDLVPVTFGGRLVGVLTVIVGVASYGVFLTLFGGAWMDVLRERREKKALQLNPGTEKTT